MIVYVITKLELGGAQKVCLELVRGVDDHMPTALISGQHGALVPAAKSLPRAFLLPSLQREVRLLGFVHDARTFFAIWRLLRQLKKEHKYMVVHTHSTKAGIIGRWAAWSAGIKQRVHTIHGYSFHDYLPWYTWLAHYQIEWLTSLITTHFVCVSEKDRQTGIRLFPRFAQKSSIIRAAVDAKKLGDQSFIPAYRADKPLVIGTIACFKPQKNLLDLLQAFQRVHAALLGQGQPAPKLEIIGDGQQRAIIETWLQQHHLTEAVRLLGWQNDVQPFLQQWDIFALTSLWEGCCLRCGRHSRNH
ncbi:glycosyltransferase [bacterium]|nr:glycosyltransferase [bacterium]